MGGILILSTIQLSILGEGWVVGSFQVISKQILKAIASFKCPANVETTWKFQQVGGGSCSSDKK